MKKWLRIHRYLGAFCAPMLILFAISGSWQVRNFHKAKKDGYTVTTAETPEQLRAYAELSLIVETRHGHNPPPLPHSVGVFELP